jgi:hypothetical protein
MSVRFSYLQGARGLRAYNVTILDRESSGSPLVKDREPGSRLAAADAVANLAAPVVAAMVNLWR